MSKVINAFLVDPVAATISPVRLNSLFLLKELYRTLECKLVDRVWLDDTHLIYVDGEALMAPVAGILSFAGIDTLIAGKALILADDGAGGDVAPTLAIEYFAERFTALRPVIVPTLVSLKPISPGELGGAIVHATRIGGMQLQLEKRPLKVKAA